MQIDSTAELERVGISSKSPSILVIGAHPDDAEHICGATLSLYATEGSDINVITLTGGDKWHINDTVLTKETIVTQREKEAKSSLNVLGGSSIEFLRFEDGKLLAQNCLEPLIECIRRLKPDLLITHSALEKHPDHYQTHLAVARICNLFGEPMPLDNPRWCSEASNIHRPKRLFFHATLEELWREDVIFVEMAEEFIKTKIKAILCHQSQIRVKDVDRIRTQVWESAHLVGRIAGCEFAEAFRVAPGFLPRKYMKLP